MVPFHTIEHREGLQLNACLVIGVQMSSLAAVQKQICDEADMSMPPLQQHHPGRVGGSGSAAATDLHSAAA